MITVPIVFNILKNINKNFTIELLMTYLQGNRLSIYQRIGLNHVKGLADVCTC